MNTQGIVILRRVAAAGLLGASLFAVAASAQAPAPPASPPLSPPMRDRDQSSRPMFALRLAERLAGLQIYLGITPAELPQWNAFTAAVLAMPSRRPDDAAGRTDAFAGIDAMADRLRQRAAAAQTVSHAAADLKSVLTPDQITKADAAWTSMQQMHDHWMHRPGGWHPDRMMPPRP
jgi:hypothetical protein